MPRVTVNMVSGHSKKSKKALHLALAEAVHKTPKIPPEWVKIQVVEIKDEDHSIGGGQVYDLPKTKK